MAIRKNEAMEYDKLWIGECDFQGPAEMPQMTGCKFAIAVTVAEANTAEEFLDLVKEEAEYWNMTLLNCDWPKRLVVHLSEIAGEVHQTVQDSIDHVLQHGGVSIGYLCPYNES